jgi:hypothetical protein
MQLYQPAAALMESTNARCGCLWAQAVLRRLPHHPGSPRLPKNALTRRGYCQQRIAIRHGVLHADGRDSISRINAPALASGRFTGHAWQVAHTANVVHPIPAKIA